MDPLISQVTADGNTYNYQFNYPAASNYQAGLSGPFCPVPRIYAPATSQINPAEGVQSFTFNSSNLSLPVTVTDENLHLTTYVYSGAGANIYNESDLVGSITKPSGLNDTYNYDSRGNIIKHTITNSSGSIFVSSYVYPASCTNPSTCNKPTSYIDNNGNETDWTYASWGGTLSEMGPAPTAGAARPLKLYTYQQLSANVLNVSGALVSTGQPIWFPAIETVCQTLAGSSALTCDSNQPLVTTNYLYGAASAVDNLLLRGKQVSGGGIILTTCYSYDQWGHKISETAPRANLTGCT